MDAGDTAISNTKIVSDKPGPAQASTRCKFATTPKMSTYLVAWLVGDFKCTEGKSDGVPIRACATPDKVELTKFALDSAKWVLHYYDNYFGIKYPMAKLDMVAMPDFEAGAMENFGCITFRETEMLVDSKTDDDAAKKRVAETVAHEMAHQWFGDLVTMEWWDNLWLNEGFATWMETKAAAKWKPEWNFPQDDAQELNQTLNLDAQTTTRDDSRNGGDSGGDQRDVRRHRVRQGGRGDRDGGELPGRGGLPPGRARLSGGASVWKCDGGGLLERADGELALPVDKIMSSFVTQAGVPLLTVSERQASGVPVAQSRFFLSMDTNLGRDMSWTVPVCLKTTATPICRVLTPEDRSIPIPMDVGLPVLYVNAGGKGYYRTNYTPSQYSAIVAKVETSLTPPERIGLLGDRWALVRSGQGNIGGYLDLVLALKADPNAAVLDTAHQQMQKVDSEIASGDDRNAFQLSCNGSSSRSTGHSGARKKENPSTGSNSAPSCSRFWGTRAIPPCWPRLRP